MSGSLSWECLFFISWRSWQKESRFWKTWESLSELWERKQWIPVHNKAFLPVHSQTSSPVVCCDCCPQPCAPWRDCSGTWQSEGLIHNKHASRHMFDRIQICKALKRKYFLTSVMRDPFYSKWPSLPVKEQHSCVHIHRDSLSAVPHHLHLKTQRNTTVYKVRDQLSHNRP